MRTRKGRELEYVRRLASESTPKSGEPQRPLREAGRPAAVQVASLPASHRSAAPSWPNSQISVQSSGFRSTARSAASRAGAISGMPGAAHVVRARRGRGQWKHAARRVAAPGRARNPPREWSGCSFEVHGYCSGRSVPTHSQSKLVDGRSRSWAVGRQKPDQRLSQQRRLSVFRFEDLADRFGSKAVFALPGGSCALLAHRGVCWCDGALLKVVNGRPHRRHLSLDALRCAR